MGRKRNRASKARSAKARAKEGTGNHNQKPGLAPTGSAAGTSETKAKKPIDSWLELGSAIIGLVFAFLPKTENVIVASLVLMFILAVHPLWNFWWIERSPGRRLGALTTTAALLLTLGYYLWPADDLYDLSGPRRRKFIQLLAAQPPEKRDKLKVGCTAGSEAGKFLIALSEAGWPIASRAVSRLEPSVPIVGVSLVAHQTEPEHARLERLPPTMGLWHKESKGEQALRGAFTAIDVPVYGAWDRELPPDVIGVYFGYRPPH